MMDAPYVSLSSSSSSFSSSSSSLMSNGGMSKQSLPLQNATASTSTTTTTPTTTRTSTKSTSLIFVTSIMASFSLLNFWREASAVKYSSLLSSSALLEQVQQTYVQDYVDLTLMEHDEHQLVGPEDFATLPKPPTVHTGRKQKKSHYVMDFVPLAEYVPPKTPVECPANMYPAPMVTNPEADAITYFSSSNATRKIPQIVHMTGKSPCLTQPFWEGAKAWQFENYSFYFHDDRAVDELLFERDWPMFPQLRNSMECLKNAGGAAKADLWRYLVIWEYGGIYTDMDNLPGELFNGTTIDDDTDAYFVQEGGGWLSQYFFALSPHHPLMFLAVHDVMREMHNLEDTGNFYVPKTTGPGATKRAFLYFMGIDSTSSQEDGNLYSKPPAGTYTSPLPSLQNRTVTVVGTRPTGHLWVQRSAIRGFAKKDGWDKMNITNYQYLNKEKTGKSCLVQLHEWYAIHAAEQHRDMDTALRHFRW